ncbi:serine hydrolase domain-containing protein [Nonomuraea typhae]|uniref:Serine hydrolase domain-containing protein n=1 Tax=Nonomuraea typhae TaxID=2603600 RepID=A0ABW7Z5U4_9ACTN
MAALVKAYTDLGRFSGTVLVARGDRVLHCRGYGMADHEHRVPSTPATRYRIGSQTKAFTAMAVLRLAERGLLDITAPLDTVLPGYPGGDRITPHHLLADTSGIPDYITTDAFTRTMALPRTTDELIATFKDRPPLFPPGERMSYSNSGWVLLGAAIERITGLPYGEHVHEHVLKPLGMTRSGLARPGEVLAGHAEGYVRDDAGIARVPYLDLSNAHAAGALHATAEDMLRWVRGLRAHTVLSPRSTALLLDGPAYGFVLEHGRRTRLESSGGIPGFVSTTVQYPGDDLTVIVLSNLENTAHTAIEQALAAIAYGEPYEPPGAREFVRVDPEVFGAWTGRYVCSYLGRTSEMTVTAEGERLMIAVQGLARTELRPLSRTRYFARMKGEVELTFVGEPAREIAMVWSGRPVTARRV